MSNESVTISSKTCAKCQYTEYDGKALYCTYFEMRSGLRQVSLNHTCYLFSPIITQKLEEQQ